MKRRPKRKCKHCGRLYPPDPRNRYHQQHCSAEACQRARHQANQRHWLAQPENQNYFRGPEQVQRVQVWRKSHPGYGRKRTAPLQDDSTKQPVDNKEDKSGFVEPALQDDFLMQPALLVGVIATLTGSALQDDIAQTVRQLHRRGQAILNPQLGIAMKGNQDASKTFAMSGSAATGATAV